jgi:hypothetical protein
MMPQQMPTTAFPQAPPGALPLAPPTQPLAWQTPPAPRTAPLQPAMPVNAAMAMDQKPRPIFRGQAPETPKTPAAPFRLPSPEALGITTGQAAPAAALPEVDWNNVRIRLRQLGAVGFHLDQVDGGQWRATFVMPAGGQQTRHVEASAASDAVAVLSALQQAETLAQHR